MSCGQNARLNILFQSGPESVSLPATEGTSSAEDHLQLKKPKLELSPSQTSHHNEDDRGGVDNNNVSPGSAFRPWNAAAAAAADGEGGGARGREGVLNGDVVERKLDPYLMRGKSMVSSMAWIH